MQGDYTPAGVHYSKLSNTRRFLCGLGAVLIAASQPRPAPLDEVRIRSAIYTPPGLTISANATLVELAVTVRDAKERAVGGLRKEDFEVFDRGERQAVTAFSANTASKLADAAESPRTIALFFDDTHAGAVALQIARAAAVGFLNLSMGPGDRVGIFTTSGAEIVDFTNDRKALEASLARLSPHSAGVRAVSGCPAMSEFEAYAITRNLEPSIKSEVVTRAIACNCPPDDASCAARQPAAVQNTAEMLWDQFRVPSNVALEVLDLVVRHLARAPERRVLLMLSPGMLIDRMEKRTSAIVDTAVRARILIHGINPAGLQSARVTGERQPILEQLMSDLTGASGGRLFHNSNDVAGEIRAATAPPENSYLLGFSPARKPDDAYHPLKVRVLPGSGQRIETRPGYFAASEEKESIQHRLDRIAASQERLAEFPAAIRAVRGAERNGQFPIHVEVQVDAAALQFAAQEGRRVQELTFVTVLEDASGAYVTGRQAVMDLALTPAKLAELQRDGIKAGLTLYASKGRYRLREVVREAVQNRIAASSSDFEVR